MDLFVLFVPCWHVASTLSAAADIVEFPSLLHARYLEAARPLTVARFIGIMFAPLVGEGDKFATS